MKIENQNLQSLKALIGSMTGRIKKNYLAVEISCVKALMMFSTLNLKKLQKSSLCQCIIHSVRSTFFFSSQTVEKFSLFFICEVIYYRKL
jgi:hypothetical protein